MNDLALLRACVADDLAMLAHLALGELDGPTIEGLKEVGFPDNLGLRIPMSGSAALLGEAVLALPHLDDRAGRDQLDADYAALFLTNGYQSPSSESPWFDEEGLERQEATFAVRQWYQREEYAPADPLRRPDDFLAFELAFLARLFAKPGEDRARLGEAAAFLEAHPGRWVARFAAKAGPRCLTPFYGGYCWLVGEYLSYLQEVVAKLRS